MPHKKHKKFAKKAGLVRYKRAQKPGYDAWRCIRQYGTSMSNIRGLFN